MGISTIRQVRPIFDGIDETQLHAVTILIGMAITGATQNIMNDIANSQNVSAEAMCAGLINVHIGGLCAAMHSSMQTLGYATAEQMLYAVVEQLRHEARNFGQ